MKRRDERGTIRTLGDAELAAATGGAGDCEGLVKLRNAAEARGDDGFAAFFQGAINGSGCSGPNCHGARTGSQHA